MSLGNELRDAAESIGDLLGQHLRLARLELLGDAGWIGQRVARLFVSMLFVLVGYVFLCAVVTHALATATSWPLALGAVAIANLTVGGVGATLALQALGSRETLPHSRSELVESHDLLRTANDDGNP